MFLSVEQVNKRGKRFSRQYQMSHQQKTRPMGGFFVGKVNRITLLQPDYRSRCQGHMLELDRGVIDAKIMKSLLALASSVVQGPFS
jgi:hypothetical protein